MRTRLGAPLALGLSLLSSQATAEQWIETWKPEPTRWFISTRIDLGYAFLRPRVAFGYGQPHKRWAGLSLVPLLSGASGGGYVGLEWNERYFSLRGGGLYLQNFTRSSLTPTPAYDRRDIDIRHDGNAQYVAFDAEAKVYVPLGSLLLRYETELFVMGMPESGMFVFVEPLALVMGEGSAVRQRLSLDFPLPRAPSLTIGPAVEPVWVASRPESPWVIRAGLSARFYLFDDVELRSDLLPVIVSPDTLGRVGSHFFEIKLRWLWATH